ncbi:MAG: hypothetical protein K2Q23_03230 [Bryobacteraceae bacterium]|nr:hypothetical protein [Bryobacteraceae bacterium]
MSAQLPLRTDQRTEDPQSWNLYAYTRNRPTVYVDQNGRQVEKALELLRAAVQRYSSPGQLTRDLSNVIKAYKVAAATIETVGPIAGNAATASSLLETQGSTPDAEHDRAVGLIATGVLGDIVPNGIGQKYFFPDGKPKTEVDIETSDALIEVKTGSRANIGQAEGQLRDRQVNPDGKPLIVYGPRLGWGARAAYENKGAKVVRTPQEVIDLLKKIREDKLRDGRE